VSTDFAATAHATPSGPVLVLTGAIDAFTAPTAHDAIEHLTLRAGDQLVVDLSGLLFCDSSGIATLIAARERALTMGAAIALAGVPRHLTRILGLLGLGGVFPTYLTADQALQARIVAPTVDGAV